MCHGQSAHFKQVKTILRALKVPYEDCDGTIVGDCGICGDGGVVTNVITFDQNTNVITSTVSGIASSVELAFTSGDITLASSVTVNGTSYPSGTSVQTWLTAVSALAHPAATFTNSNAPFNWNSATQVGNIPQAGTLTDNGGGSYTFRPGDGGPSVSFSTAVSGAIPKTDMFVGLSTGNSVILTQPPILAYHIQVFRGGLRVTNLEYSISGTLVTFTTPFGTSGGTGVETITIDYYR